MNRLLQASFILALSSAGVAQAAGVNAGDLLIYRVGDGSGFNGSFGTASVTTLATALTNEAFRGVVLTNAVPEPGSWALMPCGLGALAALARRSSRT